MKALADIANLQPEYTLQEDCLEQPNNKSPGSLSDGVPHLDISLNHYVSNNISKMNILEFKNEHGQWHVTPSMNK